MERTLNVVPHSIFVSLERGDGRWAGDVVPRVGGAALDALRHPKTLKRFVTCDGGFMFSGLALKRTFAARPALLYCAHVKSIVLRWRGDVEGPWQNGGCCYDIVGQYFDGAWWRVARWGKGRPCVC